MNTTRINLLNFDREHMRSFFSSLGEKPFRGDQVLHAIHQQGITSFEKMSTLGKRLRQTLTEQTCVLPPACLHEAVSPDGTTKWLFDVGNGDAIETVFIPESDRGTLCVSSQLGCLAGCVFCATGGLGFKRNLTTAEIIGQVFSAKRLLSESGHPNAISNIVLMGMGEPLLNLKAVIPAVNLMLEDLAYGLSKYRVTISTVGIVPVLKRLRALTPASLAVSLHAPTDELRAKLVPLNQRYPLAEILAVCQQYFAAEPKRQIVFEYVLIAGINDSEQDARLLVKALSGIRCKINLIPCNPVQGKDFYPPDPSAAEKFRAILQKKGIITLMRRTRGDTITAACGQLVGRLQKDKERRRSCDSCK